jgi:hypothetical protein
MYQKRIFGGWQSVMDCAAPAVRKLHAGGGLAVSLSPISPMSPISHP